MSATGEVKVSTAHLPNTGSRLFGRDPLLSQLDGLWNDAKLNIVSIVAAGGVGKSALVNYWLDRLAADGWRGARRVYGHSFYSQGTQHETASTDIFINEALRWFGDEPPAEDRRSPWAKGQRLAELVREKRTLLILDGMEPLQLPPGPNAGAVNDPALQSLLRELAADNPGLCIITTRMHVADLERFASTTKEIDLGTLPPEDGAELLRSLGVEGPDEELLQASEDFGNHALALTLLGTYLSKAHGGDVRRRDEISLSDADLAITDGHAHRVIASYERWFKDNGRHAEVSILRMLGLFNRPAEKGCIDALRAGAAIAELTDGVAGISDANWNLALSNLRAAGLLAKPDEQSAAGALDCHPLVREHFGDALREDHAEAWRAGNDRLYEYLKGPGCEMDLPDTLPEMQPLFAAVTHGCAAGRHQEAFDDVYWRRIARGQEFFSTKKLGAFGADRAALKGMFEEPWKTPVASLNKRAQALVLRAAGFALWGEGRLAEAEKPLQAAQEAYLALALGLGSDSPTLGSPSLASLGELNSELGEFDTERKECLRYARIVAGGIGQLYLALGEIEKAIGHAKQVVAVASLSSDPSARKTPLTWLADALHQGGQVSEAQALFDEAERMRKPDRQELPMVSALQSFHCCDLLLTRGDHQGMIERATRSLKRTVKQNSPLDIALGHVSLGRAHLLTAQAEGSNAHSSAHEYLDQAMKGLREATTLHYIPYALLARAELHIFTRDFDDARADLDEAYDIATRDPLGHMRLHVTDYHLLSARLELARADAEAERTDPLPHGRGSDPALHAAHEAGAAKHRATAGKHADDAEALIEKTGYHRRDGDLAELRKRLA